MVGPENVCIVQFTPPTMTLDTLSVDPHSEHSIVITSPCVPDVGVTEVNEGVKYSV